MSYRIFFTTFAVRMLKKLDPHIKALVIKEIEKLKIHPVAFPSLSGNYSFLRSFHFNIKGVAYRIIFEMKDTPKEVIVHLLGKRENIYELLRRLFR